MNRKKMVIALGGNALQIAGSEMSATTQIEALKLACEQVVKIYELGYDIALVHGNGPQVGAIFNAFDSGDMPFDVCGAMSQGYIGYHLQQILREKFLSHGYDIPVATVLTEVLVDENDPAFENPTKPVGGFYDEDSAKEIAERSGYVMMEDAGRGYRRVVPSPMPQYIVEIKSIKKLAEDGVVIACGGGGIPVISGDSAGKIAAGGGKKGNAIPSALRGVEAVIDKDYAACLLAEELDADLLLILTAIEYAAINYGKPNQQNLREVSSDDVLKYAEEGHFAPGSMLPKMLAAAKFAKMGKLALITSLDNAADAVAGKTGTVVT